MPTPEPRDARALTGGRAARPRGASQPAVPTLPCSCLSLRDGDPLRSELPPGLVAAGQDSHPQTARQRNRHRRAAGGSDGLAVSACLRSSLLVPRGFLHTWVGTHLHCSLHRWWQKTSNEPCSVGERLTTALLFLHGTCTLTHLVILPSGHEREAIFSPNRNFLWRGDRRVRTASCAGKWGGTGEGALRLQGGAQGTLGPKTGKHIRKRK